VFSDEVIEEIQRLQNEFGRGQVRIVDEFESGRSYTVTSVDFDPDNQVITVSADR
jgi:hypothetical protein